MILARNAPGLKGFGRFLSLHGMGIVLVLAAGCNYVVKNDQHLVYSMPTFGADNFVLVHGYNIHYVEAGEGSPILLIPGAFTTYRVWNRMLPDLSRRHRVLAIDYIGVGDSDKPETGFGYSVEEQADVIAKMIVALRLSRVNMIGASYGGAIALNLATRYPDLVNKVMCIEGGALVVPEVLNYSTVGSLLHWPILGDISWGFMKSGLFDLATARSVMADAWHRLGPEGREEITTTLAANMRTAARSSWLSIYRAITRRTDFTDLVRNTRTPVLYLYGEESKYRAMAEMNAAVLSNHVPNIEIVRLRSGIHDLHLQYPGEVARIATEFFDAKPAEGTVTGDPLPARTDMGPALERDVH